jgi:large subunit ribosomal protein L10
MENPRPEKVAVVEEVRERLASANASVITEYRGLTVTQLAELRKALSAVGDYKVYKNTLVRLAVAGGEYEGLSDLLVGPTAIAFVNGELSAAAKALRDFARLHPALIVKGGFAAGSALSTEDLTAMADLPSREVLLSRLAGGLAAPLQQLAGLLQALPRNLAYGISALLDERRAAEPEATPPPSAAAPAEESPAPAPVAPDEGDGEVAAEAETPAEDVTAGATETAQAEAAPDAPDAPAAEAAAEQPTGESEESAAGEGTGD